MALDDLKGYMIGVVLFILVIASGTFMIGSFFNADNSLDPTGQVSTFNSSLNAASEMTTAVNSVDTSIRSAGNSTGALGWLDVLIGTTYNGLKAVGGTMEFVGKAGGEAADQFFIPGYVIGIISLIATIIIIFAIWSAITKT